jgi:hypothetical protein
VNFKFFVVRCVRGIISFPRKNYSFESEVYSGENCIDYLLDLFPADTKPLKEPIFLIGCARSGTTITFSLLQRHPDIACLYEPNIKWMNFFKQRRDTNEHGDLLYPEDATLEVRNYLYTEFNKYRKREGKSFFAEKDPRNSIRLDFIYTVFADARFVILFRNPYDTIISLMKRHEQARRLYAHKKKENQWWRSGDGWAEQRIPGWKDLREKPVFTASLAQYKYTIEKLLSDMKRIPEENRIILKFEDLLKQPALFQEKLYKFLRLPCLDETRSVLGKIRQPIKSATEKYSLSNISIINTKCSDIFYKIGYEMLSSG